jgi:pyruvate kinase
VHAIVTVPPHADFLEEVARHPVVGGLRLNTVMPIKGTPAEVLARLASLGQPLWIDLKGRQLRVAEAAVPPFTEVRLSHRITVRTPTTAVFKGGAESARVLEVDGDRLILEDGPRCVLGPGESLNIPDGTLEIEGELTDRDREYVAAAAGLGLHRFMLSFVESPADVAAVQALDPAARVVQKIESRRGLDHVARHGAAQGHLMAARGDLHLELRRPHHMLRALRSIREADPDAIVASRLFDSLAWQDEPAAQDLTDAAFLIGMGYRRLMLGDEVCLRRDSVLAALDTLHCVIRDVAPAASTLAA